jgi:limonene-1,2-epoxide hydrolase
MSSHIEIVRAFIAAWERRDVDAIVAAAAPDIFYHNMPMQPVVGREALRAACTPFLGGATEVRWDILAIAETSDGKVLTERLDTFVFGPDRTVAVPVMGVFEVRDGLIAVWRDYFDLADFQKQMA